MAVTQNVILDLLPLYLSDEASPDTRVLVQEHLDNDPNLAQLAAQWKNRLPEPASPPWKLMSGQSRSSDFRSATHE